MSSNRTAAIALVGGSLAGLVVMALHPTGHDVVQEAAARASNFLVRGVHAFALIGAGAVLAGALALTNVLRTRRDLAIAGVVFFALATFTVVVAAAASGFIAPSTLRGYADADEAARATMLQFMRYTGRINQAFAQISVMFTGVALLCWSWATLEGRELGKGIGAYGVVLGVAMLVGIFSGHLVLDIHGYGAVVLGQGVWMAWAAARLWRVG